MGKSVALDGPALAVARREFGRYYRAHPPPAPERYTRREFAAFPFAPQTVMRRHASFRSVGSFARFLAEEAPRHVYYSSAYYREPDRPTMAEKGWLGADLIFDLDADHLRGAEALDYPGQLRRVKLRFRQLLDEFLFGDFGIDPDETTLVFSGGRGYHVHVRDRAFLALTSGERREIIEYILGIGVDPTEALEEERAREGGGLALAVAPAPGGTAGARGGRGPRTFQRLVAGERPGWPGRISRSVRALLARWEREGVAVARAELASAGLGPEAARRIARELVDRGRARWVRDGLTLELFGPKDREAFLGAVLRLATVEVQGETDAPVTTDVHRLIRLPGSRHGGTGLVARTLRPDGLEAFEPLRDAVAEEDGAPPLRVVATARWEYPFGDGTIAAAEGETVELGPSAALFVLLRGEATLTPPAGAAG
jgi:DNA primase small subunit